MLNDAFSYLRVPEGDSGSSQLRLQTIVRLRWLAIVGQLAAVAVVTLVLGFRMPLGWCLFLIACSAWLNVFLSLRFPARYRLSIGLASALLSYDILQLAALLYLTGGTENPFIMLLLAPVTVSAATLPPLNTLLLGGLAACACAFIAYTSYPLPWFPGESVEHPPLYDFGVLAAMISSMAFIALYARRLTREGKEMAAALTATELVLAREQKLHALDGLAAAAAHELGTPLSTIVLVTKELQASLPPDSPLRPDLELLRDQALRCRDILQKLTRRPSEQDPLHAQYSLSELLTEAAAPYAGGPKPIHIFVHPMAGTGDQELPEPVALRRPGVLYGLGNILENAVDFARKRVDLSAEWDLNQVIVTVSDDGPGFRPEIIDSLGEPYVTTRSTTPRAPGSGSGRAGGLGLGFFIAKTLLERSGARITLENRAAPQTGAVVRLVWRRSDFEADTTGPATAAMPLPRVRPRSVEVFDR